MFELKPRADAAYAISFEVIDGIDTVHLSIGPEETHLELYGDDVVDWAMEWADAVMAGRYREFRGGPDRAVAEILDREGRRRVYGSNVVLTAFATRLWPSKRAPPY